MSASTKIRPDIDDRALIERQLRRLYDAYAAEPVPRALLDILSRDRSPQAGA
jgi:hypothetical protein